MNRVSKLTTAALGVAMVGSLFVSAEARNPYGNASVQSLVQSNFATRQAQLRSEISAGVNAGTLNPGTAAALLGKLDQINAQTQGDLAYGGISNGEANRLNLMFTSVTQQLQAATAGTAYASPYASPYAAGVRSYAGVIPYGVQNRARRRWY
ncbi:MAG TPA: hypothetical protein V6D22_04170 [Candidatus Obscuribacterales bacterium]